MRTCEIEGCSQPVAALALCRKHYWQERRTRLSTKLCSVPACGKAQFCTELCRGHYARKLRGQETNTLLRPHHEASATVSFRLTAATLEALKARALEASLPVERLVSKIVGDYLGLPG